MSALGTGLDLATKYMCQAAGVMITVADEFPPCIPMGKIMGLAVGGPGTMAEGARSWGDGATALGQAQQSVTQSCHGLSPDEWSGEDRAAFDQTTSELAAQMGDAQAYATVVGATLAALSVPLAAYGPVCLTIGGIMLAEAIAFDAAVASVVGNLGASEAIYAEACAVAAVCLEVITAYVWTVLALMEAAAITIVISDAVDIKALQQDGDENAGKDFEQAQVDGLGEVATNVEGWAVGVGTSFIPGPKTGVGGLGGKAIDSLLGGLINQQIQNDNKGIVDLVTGKDPKTVITDTLGITPQVALAEDVAEQAKESGEKLLDQLPDDLADVIEKGANWQDHTG